MIRARWPTVSRTAVSAPPRSVNVEVFRHAAGVGGRFRHESLGCHYSRTPARIVSTPVCVVDHDCFEDAPGTSVAVMISTGVLTRGRTPKMR